MFHWQFKSSIGVVLPDSGTQVFNTSWSLMDRVHRIDSWRCSVNPWLVRWSAYCIWTLSNIQGNKKLRGFCQHPSFILLSMKKGGNFCVSNVLFDGSLLILSIKILKKNLEEDFFRLYFCADLFQSGCKMLKINLQTIHFS